MKVFSLLIYSKDATRNVQIEFIII